MSATTLNRRPLAREMSWPRIDANTARFWLCAGPALALMLVWTTNNGGYATTTWLGGGVALVALAGWMRLVFGPTRALGGRGRIALCLLGLYVIWSYASVLWAVDKGAAATGSDRALLYLVVFGLFAGLEWTTRRLELAMTAYLLGVCAFIVVVLVELALGPAPQLFQSGQLSAGMGYHNATAALGTIGALGALVLGSTTRRKPAMRIALATGAAACLALSVLAQSRGWLYTLPLIVVCVVALAPSRGRVVGFALIPVLAVSATLPWTIHGAGVGSARAALVSVLVTALGAFVFVSVQGRFTLSKRGRRLITVARRSLAAGLVLAVAGGAVYAVGSGKVTRGWHQFTRNAPVATSGVERFGQLGSGRYDIWRVAMNSFTAHPLGGIGQDNFAEAYVASRRTSEEPSWVHSLELRLLTHTGLVGFALFAAFIVFAIGAYRRAASGADRRMRLVLAAALVPAAVWLIHGSLDWFWEVPALSLPAFAFLGAAVALEPDRSERPSRIPGLALVAGAAVALLFFGSAYIGERALSSARSSAASNPGQALTDTRLAAQLEPYSSAPQALAAGIELRAGNSAQALHYASTGLSRDPGSWVLWLEDGLAKGASGNTTLAREAYERAHALDPAEPVVAMALQRASSGHPLTINDAATILSDRAQARVK